MPATSRCMFAYGGLMILCAIIAWTNAADAGLSSGLVMGLAMFAAGAAAAQGRRSLRRMGNFFGMFLPLVAAGIYGWRAVESYRTAGVKATQPLATFLLGVASAGGIITLLILLKLRSGDGIAERGYSVTPTQAPASQAPENQTAERD